jgi:hypothetical protein
MSAMSTELVTADKVAPRPVRTTRGVAWRSGLAGLILQISIVAAFLLLGLVQAGLPGHMARRLEELGMYISLAALLLCCTLGGALWAWIVARIAGLGKQTRVAWAGALYGPIAVASILLLNEAEQYFVEGVGRTLLSVHIVFAIIFTLAAATTAGLVALAIGLALRDRRLAVKLAISASVAAGAVFLLADVLQDLLGRRVGGINAAVTATMLTVMLIGNILASLAASGVIGVTLWRWQRESKESEYDRQQ